jgi:hypothetical protein
LTVFGNQIFIRIGIKADKTPIIVLTLDFKNAISVQIQIQLIRLPRGIFDPSIKKTSTAQIFKTFQDLTTENPIRTNQAVFPPLLKLYSGIKKGPVDPSPRRSRQNTGEQKGGGMRWG